MGYAENLYISNRKESAKNVMKCISLLKIHFKQNKYNEENNEE